MRRSRLWVVAVALLAGPVSAAAPAMADEPVYTLPRATVSATVAADGSVRVTQRITFRFTGEGHGAYLDIPRPSLSALTAVTVSENGRRYERRPGAEVGVERPAGTFGDQTCSAEGAHRVAWYFDAEPGSTRTFRVDYTAHGLVTAYARHAFLQLPVWGRNWAQPLERLDVTVRLPRPGRPGETYLARGAPEGVLDPAVDASRRVTRATAGRVPGGQAVTLHLAFPAAQLDLPEERPSTFPAHVVKGDGEDRLAAMRGGDVASTYPGTDCPVPAAAGDDGSIIGDIAEKALIGLAVVGVLWLFVRGRRRRGPGGSGHSSSSDSHYYHSSGSGDSGGSGGSSDGGGGGAW